MEVIILKKRWTKKRHYIIVSILRPFFWLFFKLKYRLKYKSYKLPKEGALILSNHSMTMDPFLIGMLFNKNLYYMTSKDLFQKKFVGKLIKFLVNPIPKEKSNKGDISAIKNCISVSKENGSICIFPEGNRTFSGRLGYIDKSIVKLTKLLKKPLILCNIVGGYPSDPRWSKRRRRGRLSVSVKKVLSYEEYKVLSDEELFKLIIDNLTVDDFSLGIKFKGKDKAEYLESILYICPVCHKLHKLYTKGNKIICQECHSEFIYNEDLLLTSNDERFKLKNVFEWYNYQIDFVKDKLYEDNEIIYQDDIELYEPVLFEKKRLIGIGKVYLYNNFFKFELENENIILDFKDIFECTLVGRKKLNIYYQDRIYQIFKNRRTNLIKYMHMFYIIRNRLGGDNNGFIGI